MSEDDIQVVGRLQNDHSFVPPSLLPSSLSQGGFLRERQIYDICSTGIGLWTSPVARTNTSPISSPCMLYASGMKDGVVAREEERGLRCEKKIWKALKKKRRICLFTTEMAP